MYASDHMHIRLATAGDAAAINAIYRPNVTEIAISLELVSPTDVEMAQRIAKVQQDLPWLVGECHGVLEGYAYAVHHRERAAYQWAVETSVYVAIDARRHGVARRLYAELFAWLVRLGYYMAYAGIAVPNPASVALHETCGFAPVGVYRHAGFKHDRWWDVGWWQKSLADYRAPIAPPLALWQLNA